MGNYVDGIEFHTQECGKCGILFGMTDTFYQRQLKLKEKGGFYCPNGHSRVFIGKTEEQKLKEQLQRKQRDLEAESGRAIALKNQRDQLSKSYGKMRDRVKNGVCPCCNRTFQNLLDHMKTKHPDFDSHQLLKSLRDAFGLTQSTLADEIGVNASHISLYENEKPVAGYAKIGIERWIENN